MIKPNQPEREELSLRAAFAPETYNADKRTVEMTWTTGAAVKRYDWDRDRYYLEQLNVSTDSIDFTRLNNGAPLLANHDAYSLNSVIGVVENAWVDNGHGKATVRFSERDDVKPILQDVQDGILRNISVGYRVDQYDITESTHNQLPVYTATRWTPMEISLVTIPADSGAQLRNEPAPPPPPTEEIPMAPATEQRANETTTPVDVDQIRSEAITAERQRVADIHDSVSAAKLDAAFAQRLIDQGTPIDQARKLVLDELAKRDEQAPTHSAHIVLGTDQTDKQRNAKIDAILGRAGLLPAKDRHQKLQGNPYFGLRLLDLARQSVEDVGVRTLGLSEMDIVARAFTTSTSDFPVLLENTMHKALLSAYSVVPDTWRGFCKIGSVSDFRNWNRYKTGSIGNLDSVNELGEFLNKAIPDGEKESIAATTKGNIINVSRQMVINDDLGAFLGLSTDLGRAAARTIEAAVYAKLEANPTMSDSVALFDAAGHGNYQGTGAAIGVASLDEARAAMASQKDISGNDYLDIRPAILLCPTTKRGVAVTTVNAVYDPDTANKLQKPNAVNGIVSTIIDSPRLTGNAWYLFADPQVVPTLEVVFLNGNDQPFIEMENGFTVDGSRYKVRLDFGVGVVDYRGAYKNAGA
jgi:hypothetical protein